MDGCLTVKDVEISRVPFEYLDTIPFGWGFYDLVTPKALSLGHPKL
jgi:hypothetical protein